MGEESRQRAEGHRAPLLWLALPLMAGTAAAEAGIAGAVPPAALLVAAAIATAGAIAAVRRRRRWAALMAAGLVLAGAANDSLRGGPGPRPRPRASSVVQPTAGDYRRFCERLAGRMRGLLGLGLERRPDVAAVYRAMMLGWKKELSREQRRLFLRTGTMHLFAINGLHVGIVAAALHALLLGLRVPRAAAGAPVLAVLWLDVDTTGRSPSAVRAFLMIALAEAGAALRRPANPVAALAAAAAGVLVFAPRSLVGASFQLSYGAVAAILLHGLPLAGRIERRLPPGWARRLVPGAVGVGWSAALAGVLGGLRFFGVASPAGLAVNLLAAPAAALAIVAGFCSLAAGLAGAAFASRLCNRAAGVAIALIEAGERPLSRLPGAWFAGRFREPWIGPAAQGLLAALFLAGYAAGWRRLPGGLWLPALGVAIALILGVTWRR